MSILNRYEQKAKLKAELLINSLINGEMKTRIAFDVDGTLIVKTTSGDVPRYEIINLLLTLNGLGHTVFVWSGGGNDYAEMWHRKLGLPATVRVISKSKEFNIDLAFDDQEADLATVTIRV